MAWSRYDFNMALGTLASQHGGIQARDLILQRAYSLGKVNNLFWERYLKYKVNNRNLCHNLEGSKLLLIISVRVDWLSIRVPTCKIQL